MIQITEERLLELVEKEKKLESILEAYPEIQQEQKLTPAARRYKNALSKLLSDVETVLTNDSFKGIFQIAYVHGAIYKGPNLAKSLAEARKVLK
jgi:hypothetical protein